MLVPRKKPRLVFAVTVAASFAYGGLAAQAVDFPSASIPKGYEAIVTAATGQGGAAARNEAAGTGAGRLAQTSWNTPSIPGTGSLAKPATATHGRATAQAVASPSGATEQKFKLPSVPFARPTRPQSQPGTRGNAAVVNRTSVLANRGPSQHTPLLDSFTGPPQRPAAEIESRRPVIAVREASPPRPQPQPQPRIDASQRLVLQASAESGPVLIAANQEVTPAAEKIAARPESAADRILMSAHQSAAVAETDAEFTEIIETCRRARASQASPTVARYAGELAAWAMNRRGQLKAESGHVDEAVLDFDDAIRLDAGCWRALHNRGVLFAQAGEFAKAFDDFSASIKVNPKFAKAHSNRAALFVVAGDLHSALDDYSRAIEIDPDLAVAHRGRGRACHLLARLDEAIEHYDAAVQLTPQDAYAVACRADLLTDLGRYAEAAREYERAIQIDEKLAHAHRGAAWLLATSPDESVRDAERALECAETAIRLEGREDSLSFDTLAAAQASHGDFEAATSTLQQAIAIAPEDERGVYQERLSLYRSGRAFRIAPVRGVAQVGYQRAE